MRVWSALSGMVTIQRTPEARRIVDEPNGLGVALEAERDDHDNGTATVAFRGGDFVSSTAAGAIEARGLELAPCVTVPAHLDVDRDGDRDVIAPGDPGNGRRLTVTLVDGAGGATRTLEVVLECNGSCLEVRSRGYGYGEDEGGRGAPVLIEHHGGRLRLIVAPDINSPDRQIVDLEGARDARRT